MPQEQATAEIHLKKMVFGLWKTDSCYTVPSDVYL